MVVRHGLPNAAFPPSASFGDEAAGPRPVARPPDLETDVALRVQGSLDNATKDGKRFKCRPRAIGRFVAPATAFAIVRNDLESGFGFSADSA